MEQANFADEGLSRPPNTIADCPKSTECYRNIEDVKTPSQDNTLPLSRMSDPLDPINWPLSRKLGVFLTVCLASFVGLASALANANALVIQGMTYNKTPIEMSYSLSAATAGLMAGPVFLVPLSHIIGTSSCIFWSLIFMIGCGIWSAKMDSPADYIPFVVSRLFGGFFGSVPQILGNGVIVNLFFLHQRGKAFAVYSTFFTLGVVAGPTFDGFIIQHTNWPVEFWWTVAAQAVTLILTFLLLEEVSPSNNSTVSGLTSECSWLRRRVDLFFPGNKAVQTVNLSNLVEKAFAPFTIFFSPATVLVGIFDLVNFGWAVTINTLLSVFLQAHEPVGYGFTPQQNAAFLFANWLGILAAQLYGYFLNDRLPLFVASHSHGINWKPEYRLHSLWVPGLCIMPIGLGIFGAALQYHLHFMVLALGSFLVAFSAVASVPIPINYLVETFHRSPQEVGTTMNVWRLLLGLVVPFFIDQWEASVGIGWVFGIAAFISVTTFLGVVLLMFKGETIRRWSLCSVHDDGSHKPS